MEINTPDTIGRDEIGGSVERVKWEKGDDNNEITY